MPFATAESLSLVLMLLFHLHSQLMDRSRHPRLPHDCHLPRHFDIRCKPRSFLRLVGRSARKLFQLQVCCQWPQISSGLKLACLRSSCGKEMFVIIFNIFEINPGGIRLEYGTELFEISKTYSLCALLKLKMKVVLRVRWLLDQFDAFTLSRSQQDLSSNAPKRRTRNFCRKQKVHVCPDSVLGRAKIHEHRHSIEAWKQMIESFTLIFLQDTQHSNYFVEFK